MAYETIEEIIEDLDAEWITKGVAIALLNKLVADRVADALKYDNAGIV